MRICPTGGGGISCHLRCTNEDLPAVFVRDERSAPKKGILLKPQPTQPPPSVTSVFPIQVASFGRCALCPLSSVSFVPPRCFFQGEPHAEKAVGGGGGGGGGGNAGDAGVAGVAEVASASNEEGGASSASAKPAVTVAEPVGRENRQSRRKKRKPGDITNALGRMPTRLDLVEAEVRGPLLATGPHPADETSTYLAKLETLGLYCTLPVAPEVSSHTFLSYVCSSQAASSICLGGADKTPAFAGGGRRFGFELAYGKGTAGLSPSR